jgi:hypothetical protein
LPHQYLRLARVGQAKTRVRCDGPVICLGCAGVKRQRSICGKNVIVPCRGGRSG